MPHSRRRALAIRLQRVAACLAVIAHLFQRFGPALLKLEVRVAGRVRGLEAEAVVLRLRGAGDRIKKNIAVACLSTCTHRLFWTMLVLRFLSVSSRTRIWYRIVSLPYCLKVCPATLASLHGRFYDPVAAAGGAVARRMPVKWRLRS